MTPGRRSPILSDNLDELRIVFLVRAIHVDEYRQGLSDTSSRVEELSTRRVRPAATGELAGGDCHNATSKKKEGAPIHREV